MKVLFDTKSSRGESHADWLKIVSQTATALVERDSKTFVSLLIDSAIEREFVEKWVAHERCELIGFPRRSDAFAVRATEAELISHIAKSHDVDVIVTAGRSYALGIPLVVVRLDDATEDGARIPTDAAVLEASVATAMASAVVTTTRATADRIRSAYPFFGPEDVFVSRASALPESIGHAARRACGSAGWQQTAEIALLVEDYQGRIRRIQV